MNSILENFTDKELEKFLSSSRSFRNFLKKAGYYTTGSGAYNSAKKYLNSKGIIIPEYNYKSVFYGKIENEDFFIENSLLDRGTIKNRIIREKLIDYKCEGCNNEGIWKDKKITLELDHINGINNDNRLINLRFLCPNCHSQTDTNSGKKRKIKKKQYYCECGNEIYKNSKMCKRCKSSKQRLSERPIYEILIKDIELLGYCGTGRKYKVSDNAIRNWKKKYEEMGM